MMMRGKYLINGFSVLLVVGPSGIEVIRGKRGIITQQFCLIRALLAKRYQCPDRDTGVANAGMSIGMA